MIAADAASSSSSSSSRVVRAPLLFDARFSEYAAVENTGLRSEREDQGGLELGAGNPCFRGFD